MSETIETNGLTVDNLTLADAKALMWGTYNRKTYTLENLSFKSLGDCSSAHLRAILDTQGLDIHHPIYFKAIHMILEDRQQNPSEADEIRIVLDLVSGGVRIASSPDNVVVEIRDYDVPDDWEGATGTDEHGDSYQEVILRPE